eukprot:GHVU01135745.1.p1 GENE.GHVU01135745.1~~GHVU01135745.1.p1  ORF type:complete len:804 (+),score=103.17 GHVU01135745.1:117-2414(+)
MSHPVQQQMAPPPPGHHHHQVAPHAMSNCMTNLQPGITPGILPHTGLMGMNGNPNLSNQGDYLDHDPIMDLANNKEKTPMCLINELARFNKIQHQYTLTDEQGPAHKKIFYVKLKLGEEEYAASGASIKKAQHAAAAVALEKTQYKHPPPKPPRTDMIGVNMSANGSLTPTVELNALAMKRGEPAIYHPIEPQRPNYYPTPSMDFRGMYNQRYHHPGRFPRIFYVSLKVGQREFIGEGQTRQSARHCAAAKALKVVKNLPMPNEDANKSPTLTQPPQAPVQTPPHEGFNGEDIGVDSPYHHEGFNVSMEDSEKDALKSEISLVHEIALKRNMTVSFDISRESGPPHMRTFVTACVCGEYQTTGEGNSKKLSKKRAAEKMLEELNKLPGILPTIMSKPKKLPGQKKKNRNLIKVSPNLQKANIDYGVGINPISRLIQIQQAKKEKEPVYSLVAEKGLPRRREFVMQVTVGEKQATGVGPNKKLAKRAAAEAMLQMLGYSRPSPLPTKPSIKTGGNNDLHTGDKKVTFIDQESMSAPGRNTIRGRQPLLPGVLMMRDKVHVGMGGVPPGGYTGALGQGGDLGRGMVVNPLAPHHDMNKYSPQTTAAIAKELLDTGCSPTAESILKAGAKVGSSPTAVRPKQQLLYLADVLGFQVEFTDFPKGNNKSEFLSLVSLSTNPPQVIHGAGPTLEASHDMAAHTALKALAESGLDSVQPASVEMKPILIKSEDKMTAGGDASHVHIKTEGAEIKLANSSDRGAVPSIKQEHQ